MGRTFFITGSILAFLGVAFGAFGAHALKARLSPEDLATFQTGVQYQSYHALALLLAAALLQFQPQLVRLKTACMLFATGVVVFSGSLYALSLSGVKWLGAITPIGGVCFLAGWLTVLAVAVSLPASHRS